MLALQKYCPSISKSTEFKTDLNFSEHIYDWSFMIDRSMDKRKRKSLDEFSEDQFKTPTSNSGGNCSKGDEVHSRSGKRQKIYSGEENNDRKIDKIDKNFAEKSILENEKLNPLPTEFTSLTPKTTEFTSLRPKTTEFTSLTPKTTEFTSLIPKTTEFTSLTPKTTQFTSLTPETTQFTSLTPETTQFTGLTPKTTEFTCLTPKRNSTCKNYELRPRTFLRRPIYKRDSLDEDFPAVEVVSKRKEKSAQRLSKYRRRTANARERHRMKEINAAFKSLREVLPSPIKTKESNLTKITTLRLAVDYIQALDDLLRDPDLNLTNKSFGIQGQIKDCSTSLQNMGQENDYPVGTIGNSLSDFIFGLTSTSSATYESLCQSSSEHSLMTSPIFKKSNSLVPNFSNYSFNFDDDALLALQSSNDEDSSTIDTIAILLSADLDDDVF